MVHAATWVLLVLGIPGSTGEANDAGVTPLANAHAHNDYYHARPLLDALDHGFCSVEADVFLIDGKLLVGHSLFELDERRTLESTYLDSLAKRVAANDGRVFQDGPVFTLLVDIKRDGPKAYSRLREVLANYDDMLSCVIDGEFTERAIQVVVSGERPMQEIEADNRRFVGIDGRLSDLESDKPAHLMPLISDRWGSHFTWNGEGEFPAEQRDKLHEVVDQAHAAGRRIRFWATPESPAVWQELRTAGVDHINTDKLGELQAFLLGRER